MAWNLVYGSYINGGPSGGSTSPGNVTGANLFIVGISLSASGIVSSVTDNLGNTYVGRGNVYTDGVNKARIYDCVNPRTGTYHQLSVYGTNIYPQVVFTAWSGASQNPFDSESGSFGLATSLASGQIVPSQDGELIVSQQCWSSPSTESVSSPMILYYKSDYAVSLHMGGGFAYEIQTTKTPRNPTWYGAMTSRAIASACYKGVSSSSGSGDSILCGTIF